MEFLNLLENTIWFLSLMEHSCVLKMKYVHYFGYQENNLKMDLNL